MASNVLYYGSRASAGGYQPAPPITRLPLPLPLPRPDRDGVPWATTLPWDPAPPQTRDYLRANLWAVTMPNAPMIDGANPTTKDNIMTYLLDRYDPGFQRDFLQKYDGYGYTHLWVSAPDSCNGGSYLTLTQFANLCAKWKQQVQYLGIFLGSKVYQPMNMQFDEWKRYVDPVLDALLDIGDEFSVWEWDAWNIASGTEGPSVQVPKYLGQRCHAKGKSYWQHYFPHVTWWGAAGTDCPDRFSYWTALGADVDGLNYQGDSNWTTQEASDRMVDTLWHFGQEGSKSRAAAPMSVAQANNPRRLEAVARADRREALSFEDLSLIFNRDVTATALAGEPEPADPLHKDRYFEDCAILQFNALPQTNADGSPRGPIISPDDGDCRGYYLSCTTDNVKNTGARCWGFGNGARRPDGARV